MFLELNTFILWLFWLCLQSPNDNSISENYGTDVTQPLTIKNTFISLELLKTPIAYKNDNCLRN